MKQQQFKNAGNGTQHEDKTVSLFQSLGFHAERVGGKGNTPDIYVWNKNLKYGVECKNNLKNSASYVTFTLKYDHKTDLLSYTTKTTCEQLKKAKDRLFNSIKEDIKPYFKNTEIKKIWCDKAEKYYEIYVPMQQNKSKSLRKEIIAKKDGIVVDSSLVYDILVAKGNDYLVVDSSIIPLVDDYLHLPKLLTKKKAPNYFYARVRSIKRGKTTGQQHSLKLFIYCAGYINDKPKINSKVRIER